MGRVYQSISAGNFPPKIRFTAQEDTFPKGTWFIGTKLKEAMGKAFKNEDGTDKAPNKVFTFKMHDASDNLHIQKKNGKIWENFQLPADGEAELNGNSQLDDKVGQVPMGQRVKITYNGKKLNENSGRYFNDYTVADAE